MKQVNELKLDGIWWRDQNWLVWRQLWDEYDPGLYEAFRARFAAPEVSQAIDPKTWELLVIAVDAAVSWPFPFIDYHYHRAFDRGATVREIYETVNITGEIGGIHAVNNGMHGLVRVVRERESKNEPVPDTGTPIKAAPASPEAQPQTWQVLLKKYDPARFEGLQAWRERVLTLTEIDLKTRQLILIAVASSLKLSPASFESHIQLALDAGCMVQQVVEAIMTSGHLEGIHTVEYGLTMLDNVMKQRAV